MSDEELAERLGSLIGKSIMQVIPLRSPIKLSTSELEKISTKARFAGREVSKAVIQGQKHHLISKKIAEAIEENTPLGKINRNKPGLVVRAKSLEIHKGYQAWHRDYDNEVVKWIEEYGKDITLKKLYEKIDEMHKTQEYLKKGFPSVDLTTLIKESE